MLLAEQDRARWDAAQIAAGRTALDRALALRGRGPYVLQAAIASLHADEPRDWAQIAALYGELERRTHSPVVTLSRAVAVAEVEGPEAALAIVDGLDLDDYRYLHATRGELLRRLGRAAEAREAYAPRAGAGARRRRAAAARAARRRAGLTAHFAVRASTRRPSRAVVARARPYSYRPAPRFAPPRKTSASFAETESVASAAPNAPE